MENYHVEVKRPTGRPRLPKGDAATEAKRAKWRASNKRRYTSGNPGDSRANPGKWREILIQEHGGKCAITGSTEDLEFHHVIPSTKEFTLSCGSYNGSSASPYTNMDRVRAEAKKCVLITGREHRKIHMRVNRTIREIKKYTDLTPKGEAGLRDYYTERYTKQAIAIGQIQAA